MTSSTSERGAGSASESSLRRWLPWLAMAVVVVAALLVGTVAQSTPTDAERAQHLAETIRCPSCKSQSSASSDTPASLAVRALIKERIAEGDSDEEIRDYVASRYGREVLLDPAGSGVGTLVWALPVIFVVVAVAALALRFRGYRSTVRHATDDDRALVAEALAHEHEHEHEDERGGGAETVEAPA